MIAADTRRTLDYVLLAGLLRRPQSGYDLAAWMNRETSHYFSVGHSSIYPALARLERDGLTGHESVASEVGPARKVYTLTPAGYATVLTWAAEPPVPGAGETMIRVLCYGFLPVDVALARLTGIRAHHLATLARYRGYGEAVDGQLQEGLIAREAWVGTRLTLRRGVLTEESAVAWCDEALVAFSAGGTSVNPPPTVAPKA